MRDRQVEVVAGSHVVARVAGAVIVVAHRGRGRLTAEEPAAIAAESLAELVGAAAEREPAGPGALIAREATRWLMKHAEQISPGTPVDFGVLSAAENGGVAIFLHGAVTAVLVGEQGQERYRGSDAAFTVDRVASVPATAVALFVDDGKGRVPEVPTERGIGWLVEGLAQAGGAVVWSDGARRGRGAPALAADRAPMPPTARIDPEPRAAQGGSRPLAPPVTGAVPATSMMDAVTDANVPPFEGGRPRPATPDDDDEPTWGGPDANLGNGPGIDYRRGPGTGAEHRVAGPANPAVSGARAADAGRPPGHRTGQERPVVRPGTGAENPVVRPAATGPGHPVVGPGSTGADHPTVGPGTGPGHPLAAGGPAAHEAETRLSGTNPAPEPDPSLQRRLEATARTTPLTVRVMGFKCARAHPSDPRSAFCTVCGMPVDQTQSLIEVVRPPLGMLVLDDGMTYLLAADAVIGRDPEHSEAAQRGLVPLRVDDSSGGMSRAHAEVHLVNWDVTVVDRGSTNGTRTRHPGYRDWIRLTPNQPITLVPGTEVMIGNRVLRFEPAAPPPFG
ncbi:FHA domain-containing protein [Nocardia thailandica]